MIKIYICLNISRISFVHFWHPLCNLLSIRENKTITQLFTLKNYDYEKVLVAVALVMGLGSSVAFAQEVSNTPVVENQTQAPQDEYTKVEVKDLPEAVAQAIAKSYEGATIKEAYVAEKETGKVYKVILTTKDAQEVTVLLNEKAKK